MKIAFDAFWWTEGPISNRNVMQEIIRTWIEEYPEDEVHLIGAPRSRKLLMDELGLPARQIHEVKLGQHGLAILFEYALLQRRIDPHFFFSHNFVPLVGRATSVFVQDLIFATNPEWFTRSERIYFWMMRKSLRKARIIFTSSNTEALRITRYSGSLASVHPTGLAMSSELKTVTPLNPYLGLKAYGFTLIVGRLNERKNLSYGLRVLKESGKATSSCPVIVVGEKQGKSTKLDAEVADMVNSGSVQFVGYMDPAHLAWLYSNARLVVFPTLDEGFGLPVIEGRYFGAPLALSDVPILREVAGESAASFFPLDDLRAAAEIVKRAVIRESGMDDASSRESLLQQYDWKRTVTSIRNSLKNLPSVTVPLKLL